MCSIFLVLMWPRRICSLYSVLCDIMSSDGTGWCCIGKCEFMMLSDGVRMPVSSSVPSSVMTVTFFSVNIVCRPAC